MRTPNLGTVQFVIGDPAEFKSLDDLARYVRDLELRAYRAITAVAEGQIDVSYAAPAKPRRGMIRYADGTSWNPGGGEGMYFFNGAGVWIKLG